MINYARDTFDADEYRDAGEPTDAQTLQIVRGLAHCCVHWVANGSEYDSGRTIESFVLDVLEANAASDPQFTRDECVALARFFGLAV